MSLKYERRLLDHLAHDRYTASDVDRLARDLGVDEDSQAEFQAAVDDLVERGRLVRDAQGALRLPPLPEEVEGMFKKNVRGFGFVIPATPFREGDVFIPPDAVADALTGDTVRARVYRDSRARGTDKEISGEIVEVVKRRRAAFTGELVKRGGLWLVLPDGKELTQPVVVKDPSVKNAKEGDKVAVEITTYPIANELGEGVITRVLGESGLPDVETQAVIIAYSLPQEFPKECLDQARAAAARFEREIAEGERAGFPDRHDLRERFIVTIDPMDSKDFDDAISIEATPEGWFLGVHIADVAHFIPPGSPLDVEARDRGNSCYLPRHVIPMLPEVLSNGICSLSEGVPRFCKSAFMSYSKHGEILGERVGATLIRSAKRLTYLEAQALIDGDLKEARKHARTEPKYSDQLIKTLREFDKLAKAIRARRKKAGMIHLELPEVELIFDDAGHVVDAQPEDNAFTHTLIEMFMVEANEVLARLFEGMDVPLLRRVHPEPTPGDVGDLRSMARVAGYAIPKAPTRQDLQALLDATAGTPAARAVHFAVLRTLTKAEYSPARIGHFALASEAYAHFTSPIRRYADLTVHRALAAYLELTENGAKRPRTDRDKRALGRKLLNRGPEGGVIDEDELVEIGRHVTDTEGRAEAAEQSLRQFLVLQLLQNHMGESFPAVVTGVTGAGVFVQIEKYLAEGMIRTQDLPSPGMGRWFVDQRTGALVHQGSGRSFSMGDRVTVVIANIDLALRRMDLIVADAKSRDAGKAKRPSAGAKAKAGAAGASGGGVGDDLFHKNRVSGSKRRAQRSRQRDQQKTDFRAQRKKKKGR
jgi:ribonuclease R